MVTYSKQLEEDLKWREAELASLKVLAVTAEKGSARETSLLRGLIALLYAHYEGFCKYAWDLYLEALEKEMIKRRLLKCEIAMFSLEADTKAYKKDLSEKAIWDFHHNTFPALLEDNVEFKVKLETDSNLWPNVLEENAKKILMRTDYLKANSRLIKALVSRRNDIAHGKKNYISSVDDYHKYENAAFLVMHEVAVNIIESLEAKDYLK